MDYISCPLIDASFLFSCTLYIIHHSRAIRNPMHITYTYLLAVTSWSPAFTCGGGLYQLQSMDHHWIVTLQGPASVFWCSWGSACYTGLVAVLAYIYVNFCCSLSLTTCPTDGNRKVMWFTLPKRSYMLTRWPLQIIICSLGILFLSEPHTYVVNIIIPYVHLMLVQPLLRWPWCL